MKSELQNQTEFKNFGKMKTIILTIDYELFLGKDTGTVSNCMIEPTKKLASILDKNDSKMTIFWDILHYYRLLELENSFSELKQDRILIENQILELAKKGHDIQLHLHPHWLDTQYKNGGWHFNYDRFKLHNLSEENKPEDINTIIGCISITKQVMENLIRKVKPEYKVTTYRAGGYLIEPFEKLKEALFINAINADSSVCPGLYNASDISPYDFRDYPANLKYHFNSTPKTTDNKGDFIEIPITSFKFSGLRNFYYRILKKLKYPRLENERKGSGVGSMNSGHKATKNRNLLANLFKSGYDQFTTDSNFKEKFDFMYKNAKDYSTMILHPKLLNSHTIELLDQYVSTNKIRFISIQNFLS